MAPDECAAKLSQSDKKINLSIIDDDESPFDTLLISGDAEALRNFANMVLAVADQQEENGFQVHPNGAGSRCFGESATLGLYINRE